MCGIAGFYNVSSDFREFPRSISRMIALIRHRGPDEIAFGYNETTALASARLSIIDIKQGQQPLRDVTKRYWIVFNGELYNYKELKKELIVQSVPFKTESDTEVVLNAYIHWGTEAFKKFNGAFALAIYDSKKNTLLLSRDPFGEKPLYYQYKNNTCFFS